MDDDLYCIGILYASRLFIFRDWPYPSKKILSIFYLKNFCNHGWTLTLLFRRIQSYVPGFEDGEIGIFKFAGFGITAPDGGMGFGYADGGYTWWTDFLFQGMFAATAATIVSGAVAERIKLSGFMLFSILYVGLVYPIVGSWKWGGGFLDAWGFYDFAGSTLVHSVGGWGPLLLYIF